MCTPKVGCSLYLKSFVSSHNGAKLFVCAVLKLMCPSLLALAASDSISFSERMVKQSGVGPKTAWPPGIVRVLKDGVQVEGTNASREEAEVA